MSSPHEIDRASNVPTWPLLASVGLIILVALGWATTKDWEKRQDNLEVARALTGGDPTRAAALVTRYGCGGCHTISGIPGATGKAAPPLTDLRERVYIGGVLPNTAPNLIGWIVNPRAFSSRTAMPATGISKEEARDVAAYLYAQ
jgi:mono/diheme cytochrome c family protein